MGEGNFFDFALYIICKKPNQKTLKTVDLYDHSSPIISMYDSMTLLVCVNVFYLFIWIKVTEFKWRIYQWEMGKMQNVGTQHEYSCVIAAVFKFFTLILFDIDCPCVFHPYVCVCVCSISISTPVYFSLCSPLWVVSAQLVWWECAFVLSLHEP